MTRRILLPACFAVFGVLLAGCDTISRAYDRTFGSAPAQKPAELPAIKTTATLSILWQGSVGGAGKQVFFPAVSGNVIYAAGEGGNVTGFDLASGNPVVRIDAAQRVSGGVGVGSGLVLLGTPRGEVLAFDSGGKPAWKAQLAGEVLASPEARDGTVVARAGDGYVYGLDAASGKRKWTYKRATPALSVRSHAGVIIDRGAVFVGFSGGRLIALTLSNGNIGWDSVVALPRGTTELERVSDITSHPAIDAKQVCAVAFQGRVACLDLRSGAALWGRDISSLAGLALDAHNLYVTNDKNAVTALNKVTGASLWRQDRLLNRRVTRPLPLGRYIVVGDVEGYVHLISREDGAFAARIATDGSAISAPPVAIDANSFVVQTVNGGVYAITVR